MSKTETDVNIETFRLIGIEMDVPVGLLDDCPECAVDICPSLNDLEIMIRRHQKSLVGKRILLTLSIAK